MLFLYAGVSKMAAADKDMLDQLDRERISPVCSDNENPPRVPEQPCLCLTPITLDSLSCCSNIASKPIPIKLILFLS